YAERGVAPGPGPADDGDAAELPRLAAEQPQPRYGDYLHGGAHRLPQLPRRAGAAAARPAARQAAAPALAPADRAQPGGDGARPRRRAAGHPADYRLLRPPASAAGRRSL